MAGDDGIVLIESTYMEGDVHYVDAVRRYLRVAEERGHASPKIVVGASGVPLTGDDYVDEHVAVHPDGERMAFARHLRNEPLGAIIGTDWVKMHDPSMAFRTGLPFTVIPHIDPLVYADVDGTRTVPFTFDLHAPNVAWSTGGDHVATVCLAGGSFYGTDRHFRLVEWHVPSGRRRVIATLTGEDDVAPNGISYSGDDTHLLLTDSHARRSLLVDRESGVLIPLPLRSAAVDWAGEAHSSSVLAIVRKTEQLAEVRRFDLSTWELETLGILSDDRKVDFRELAVHPDGRRALATAPVGTSASVQDEVRGGMYAAAVIDFSDMTFEAVMPATFRTGGAQRVHRHPQWRVPRRPAGPVEIGERGAAVAVHREKRIPDDRMRERIKKYRLEALAAIARAWAEGDVHAASYRADYAALADGGPWNPDGLGYLRGLDMRSSQELLDIVGTADPVESMKARIRLAGVAAGDLPRERLSAPVRSALEDLIGAYGPEQAQEAARDIVGAAPGGYDNTWSWLLAVQLDASSLDAAKIALACFNWTSVYADMFPALLIAMPLPESAVEQRILRNGYGACLRLQDDDLYVAEGRERPFDVGEILARCANRLEELE